MYRWLASDADPDCVALPNTGESTFLKSVAKKTVDSFTEIPRDPKSNVLGFAEHTDAHFVLVV